MASKSHDDFVIEHLEGLEVCLMSPERTKQPPSGVVADYLSPLLRSVS